MDLSFDRNDVEAVGEGKPWTRREEFDAEIDTDHMGDTASLYARAAHEARSAGELAEVATRMGQEAGARNGQAFVEDERIDVTARGLQGNGEKMDNVVRKIVQAMNLAIDTCEEVDAQIEGGEGMMGMQQILEHNNALAERAWESAQQFFASQPMPDSLNPVVITTGPFNQAPTFTFNNTDYRGVPSGNRWSPPANLPTAIREFYLNQTAELAGQADREITDAIRQYRQRLAEYGAELERDGYDTSEGPLGLWRSEEMAAFNGEEFAKLLRQDHPDPDLLERYGAGVGSIAEDGQGPDGARRPTPQEQAYLDAFFGKLTTESLLKLGRLEGKEYESAQQMVANGIVAASAGEEPLSQIREIVNERLTARQGDNAFSVRQQAERFNDFGELMSHATLTPSKEFSNTLIDAAINAQEDWKYQRLAYDLDALEGSPQLLSLAAKNDAAAAEFVGDKNRIGQLFDSAPTASWADDGAAVGELIRNGTLPDGSNYTQGEEFKQVARDGLLDFVSRNYKSILSGQYDIPAQAELVLADVVTHPDYLHSLNKESDKTYPPNSLRAIYLTLMSGEAETAAHFKENIEQYIGQQASRIFANTQGRWETEIGVLGQLSGAVSNSALMSLYLMEHQRDVASENTYKTVQSLLGLGSLGSNPLNIASGTAYAWQSMPGREPEAIAERNDALRRYWENDMGGTPDMQRIYDAARDMRFDRVDLGEAADVIPRSYGDWNLTEDQWKIVTGIHDPYPRPALENALGPVYQKFMEGRHSALAWGDVTKLFSDDADIDEVLDAYTKSQEKPQ